MHPVELTANDIHFLDTWTRINRDGASIIFTDGQPTPEAEFAAEHAHPLLEVFISTAPDLNVEHTTLTHLAAKSSKRSNDYHFTLIQALVKAGADVHTTNEDGLTVLDLGKASENKELQRWANSFGLFLGRYNFIGPPVHHSTTCLVSFAHDVQRDEDVCLKLMHEKAQWWREIQMRVKGELSLPVWHVNIDSNDPEPEPDALEPEPEPQPEPEPEADTTLDTARMIQHGRVRVDPEQLLDVRHVVELCMEEDGLLDSRMLDTPKRASEFADSASTDVYHYLLVMPRARHDLSDAVSHYRFAGRYKAQVTHIGRQVAGHLRYLNEECGRIHGDLKLRNLIQMADPERPVEFIWNVIDLDASCKIGEPAGQKVTSSACFPPEMARQQLSKGETQSQDRAIELSRLKAAAQMAMKSLDLDRVVSLAQEIKLLEMELSRPSTAEPITASIGFEMWYFGVLLYQLCTLDGKPLWSNDQADNIDDEEMRVLAHQWESVKAAKLQKVVWDDARMLISQLLSEDVGDRPQTWLEVLDSQFLRVVISEGVPPLDSYRGWTNAEDFRQLETASVVNIISTPWITNQSGGAVKAAATKMYHDNTTGGVYTFNPNTGLRAAAAMEGMSAEVQGQKWLQLWTVVCEMVQATGGTCFVMAKGTGPDDYDLEGNAQQGELNIAKLAKVKIEFVYY